MHSSDPLSPIVAVLCDLGISRVRSGTNTMGTMGYISPEILKQQPYDTKADVSDKSTVLLTFVLQDIQCWNIDVGDLEQEIQT